MVGGFEVAYSISVVVEYSGYGPLNSSTTSDTCITSPVILFRQAGLRADVGEKAQIPSVALWATYLTPPEPNVVMFDIKDNGLGDVLPLV